MTEQVDRRARMLEKVRKLMAMARDNRGNENETEAAMRQANKLMAEFGIEEAEVDMRSLDEGTMQFGEVFCGPDGRVPEKGKVVRLMPRWAGFLSVGVARFCDAVVGRRTNEFGQILYFRGEKQDVLLARWVFGVLAESVNKEQRASGWTSLSEATAFKEAAAATLQRRLFDLARERRATFEQAQQASGSRALVVVDRKALEIKNRFGEQKVRNGYASNGSAGARMAGAKAGQSINIPAGRPVGTGGPQLKIG